MPGSDTQEALLSRALARIRALKAENADLRKASNSPIAVVGMACRFPGACDCPSQFWDLIARRRSVLSRVPSDRWELQRYHASDPDAPGRAYCAKGGFLDDVRSFDHHHFGISPREATAMDPQQRLLLTLCAEALDDAAIDIATTSGGRVGVFGATGEVDYSRRHLYAPNPDGIDGYAKLGSTRSIGIGRLAYVNDWRGPVVHLDTSCSSGLVATHLAMQALNRGEVDLAVVAAANLMLSPEDTIGFSKLAALSRSGRCQPFSADADGYVRGEGAGVLVLKRQTDALRDEDPLWGLILGSACNHDGRSNGLTAPNGAAQVAVMTQALRAAGVRSEQVGFVEAHGTGTSLGDPIELSSIAEAYACDKRSSPLSVGSVKGNIGHLEPAAGLAALIKVFVALRQQRLPPQPPIRQLNPRIDWQRSGLEVPQTERVWPEAAPLAGVSGFGMSGTNVHLLVGGTRQAEVVRRTPSSAASQLDVPQYVHLSASSGPALVETARRLRGDLEAMQPPLEDVATTLAKGRTHHSLRRSFHCCTVEQLRAELSRFVEQGEGAARRAAIRPKLAFLYSGQGAQKPAMARAWVDASPIFADALARCEDALAGLVRYSVRTLLIDRGCRKLDDTEFAQPAIVAFQICMTEVWKAHGVEPEVVLGHSVGAIGAAYAAGVLSLGDAMRLAAHRGWAMQHEAPAGAMALLSTSSEQAEALCRQRDLSVAVVNSERETVIAGSPDALHDALKAASALGVAHRVLRTNRAFHSRLIVPSLESFGDVFGDVELRPPALRFISDSTGQEETSALTEPSYWLTHAAQRINFLQASRALSQQACTLLLDIGPGRSASTWALAAHAAETRPLVVSLPISDEANAVDSSFAQALCQLVDHGAAPRRVPAQGKRIRLAPTAFAPHQHWMERNAAPLATDGRLVVRPRTAGGECRLSGLFGIASSQEFSDHNLAGKYVVAGAKQLLGAAEAASVANGDLPVTLDDVQFLSPLILPPQGATEVEFVAIPRGDGGFEITGQSRDSESEWSVHIRATGSAAPQRVNELPAGAEDGSPTTEMDYGHFERLDYRLGASYRRILSVTEQGGALTAELLPEHGVLHAGLVDGCFQLLGARAVATAGRDGQLLVPTSVERAVVLPSCSVNGRLQMVASNIRSERDRVLGDVVLTTNGRPIVRLSGITLRWLPIERLTQTAPPHLFIATPHSEANTPRPTPDPALQWWGVGDANTCNGTVQRIEAVFGAPEELAAHLAGARQPLGVVWAPQLAERTSTQLVIEARDLVRVLGPVAGAQLLVASCGGETKDAEPKLSALRALCQSIALEQPELTLCLLARDRASAATKLQPAPQEWSSARQSLAADRTYVVSGGFGAVGTECVNWLVASGARHIAILSRSGGSQERRLAELRRRGVFCLAVAVDVAEGDRLREAWMRIESECPPVGGLIHAAGLNRDGLFVSLSEEQIDEVMRPKVQGTEALLALLPEPAWAILCSSVAAMLGSPAQVPYAAANAAMDALARCRKNTCSLALGPLEIGMAADERSRRALSLRGFTPLTNAELRAALSAARSLPVAHLVAVRASFMQLAQESPTAAQLFADVVPEAEAAQTSAVEGLAEVPAAQRPQRISRFVRQSVAALLQLPESQLDEGRALIEYGFDSLSTVEFRARVARELDVHIGASELLPGTTLGDLSTLVAARSSDAPAAQPAASILALQL